MSSTSSLPNEASACASGGKRIGFEQFHQPVGAGHHPLRPWLPCSSAPSRVLIITAILSLIFRFENAAAAFRSPSGKKPVMFSLKRSCRAAAPIAATISAHIADELRAGTCSAQFLGSYYNSTVKGMFNGIYGVQAQNTLKPEYRVMADGTLAVDQATVPTAENWDEVSGGSARYGTAYGTRIVGGSRCTS